MRANKNSTPLHRDGPFIWKNFISSSRDPCKIKRDLSKLGWLAFLMNMIQFYKVFIRIARSRSEPARSTGETGVFPSKLKEAMVIPVFKNKGSLLNAENYRPIFLLSNIDKVYQKLMLKRLNNFLDNCDCLYPRQFGIRANHSTSSALINCTENIRKALDSGYHVCPVFIDL